MFSTSTAFTYAGGSSDQFGIILARTSLPTYQVGISYEPIYEKIRYIDKIYSYGNSKNLLEFELEMYRESMWTVADRMAITGWLFRNGFNDLVFDSATLEQSNQTMDIVFNCQPNGQVESCDFGGLYGIKIKFINSIPYPTTRSTIQSFVLANNDTFTIDNRSNLNEYFYDTLLTVALTGATTGFTLTNYSDSVRAVSFTNLSTLEIITMNNQIGTIVSSTTNNRIPAWNKNYLRLVPGKNYFKITGSANIDVLAKYPIII
jgi:hypothetical protein